jgi:hypothetical protein
VAREAGEAEDVQTVAEKLGIKVRVGTKFSEQFEVPVAYLIETTTTSSVSARC